MPADKLDFDAVNDISYKKTDIDQKHTTQKSKCIVIATVGGRVTRAAFTLDSNVRYVSLVGNTDNIGTALKGGVSLNSIALNAAR